MVIICPFIQIILNRDNMQLHSYFLPNYAEDGLNLRNTQDMSA